MIRFALKHKGVESDENPRSLTMTYVLNGTASWNYARAYAISATPATLNGLYRQDVKLKSQGHLLWLVTIPYGAKKAPEPSVTEYRWNFDTTGGTASKKQAIAHVQSYPTGAPNHEGAIEVHNGEVDGCEIVVPAFKWHEDWELPWADYAWPYAAYVEALTGKVNSATFRGRAAGTVRFDGAVGGQSSRNPEVLAVTFHFSGSPNATGLTVAGFTGVSKSGWDYLWVEYKIDEDTTAHRSVKVPLAVHVEQVYERADFALLGIGN